MLVRNSCLTIVKKMLSFFRFLKKLLTLPQTNLSLIFSLIFTILLLVIIIVTSITILPLTYLEILKWIFVTILSLLTVESFIKLFSQNRLFRSYAQLELLSSFPSWIIVIFFPEDFYDLSGSLLLKGMLFSRLFPLFQILLEEKTFHLKEQLPIFFNRMVTVTSISSFLFIYAGGLLTSMLYDKYLEKEKENRIIQVSNLLKVYDLHEIPKKVPSKWILKIQEFKSQKNLEIYFTDKRNLQEVFIPNIHFVYLQGKTPDEGLILSFLDLYKNKNYLELVYLITSFLMIGYIYFTLYYYYKKYVFVPLEKANTVVELRLMGEDIRETDLPDIQHYHNEIIQFIKKNDELYRKLMELEN